VIPFSATLASEWTKLTTLRATYLTVGLAVVFGAAASALAGLAVGLTWDDWSAPDRADFDPVLYPLVGLLFAGILFPILGVKAVASEYSSGMMRLTLTATPGRGRVLLAKVGAVSAVTLVGGTLATLGIFFAGQAVYSAYSLETADLFETDTLRALVAVSVLTPVFPVLAVAAAIVLRSTVGAIMTVIALIFAPGIFGTLLPEWWQDNVVRFFPGPAGDGIAISHLEEANTLSPGVAALVLAAWFAGSLAVAYVALTSRDA
jgi:ABC-2 type transport system permease protein